MGHLTKRIKLTLKTLLQIYIYNTSENHHSVITNHCNKTSICQIHFLSNTGNAILAE